MTEACPTGELQNSAAGYKLPGLTTRQNKSPGATLRRERLCRGGEYGDNDAEGAEGEHAGRRGGWFCEGVRREASQGLVDPTTNYHSLLYARASPVYALYHRLDLNTLNTVKEATANPVRPSAAVYNSNGVRNCTSRVLSLSIKYILYLSRKFASVVILQSHGRTGG